MKIRWPVFPVGVNQRDKEFLHKAVIENRNPFTREHFQHAHCLCLRLVVISEMLRTFTPVDRGLRVERWLGEKAPFLYTIRWPRLPKRASVPAGAVWAGRLAPTGRDSRHDKDRAKTGHRLYIALSLPPFFNGRRAEGQKLCYTVAGCLPHQHTAAVTRGHQPRPVKEKH